MIGVLKIADKIDHVREPESFAVDHDYVERVRLRDLVDVGALFVLINSGGGSVRMLRRINLILQITSRRAEILGYAGDSVGSAAMSIALKVAQVGTLRALPGSKFMMHAAIDEMADVGHGFSPAPEDLLEHRKEVQDLRVCFDNPYAAKAFDKLLIGNRHPRLEIRPSSNLLCAGGVLDQSRDLDALHEAIRRDSGGLLVPDHEVVRGFF